MDKVYPFLLKINTRQKERIYLNPQDTLVIKHQYITAEQNNNRRVIALFICLIAPSLQGGEVSMKPLSGS